MKKLFFLSTFLFSTFILFSQDDNNSATYKFFVGGQLGFENISQTEVDEKTTLTTFSPYLGYSINQNWILGISIGLINDKSEVNNVIAKGSTFSVTPFTRYRKALDSKMGLYGEFGVAIINGSTTYESGGNETKTKSNAFSLYLGPGIDYALANRWVVNAGWGLLSYTSSGLKDGDNRVNRFGLSLNPRSINFSLNYLF